MSSPSGGSIRALHVLSEVGTGGAAVVHRLLADALPALGAEVDVFAYEATGSDNIFGTFPRDRLFFGCDLTLTELLCRREYDIVHGASDTPDRGLGRSVALSRSRPAVLFTCHGHELPVCGFPAGSTVVAVSESMAAYLREHTNADVRSIYNGVDEAVFRPGAAEKSAKPMVAWIGRPYDVRKDFAGFAALAEALAETDVAIYAVVACPDDYPVSIGEWVPGVEVLRNLAQPVMADFYRKVAVSGGCVVSTSISEGFGMTAVEAMACGCPVVAPHVGGMGEVLDGVGVVYDRTVGIAGLKKIVLDLVGDSVAREQIARNGLARVASSCTSSRMAENYYALYRELDSSRTKRRATVFDAIARSCTTRMCRVRAALRPSGH